MTMICSVYMLLHSMLAAMTNLACYDEASFVHLQLPVLLGIFSSSTAFHD